MQKTLTRHGNSFALVIDKPILELLNIEPETPLEISTDGKVLTITPIQSTRKQRIQDAVDDANREYGKTLKNLAK